MLEIFALYQLCKTNKKNVMEKGRRPGGYIGLTIGLWFGLELIGIVIGVASGMEGGTYLLGLLFAGMGGAIAYSIAKNVSPLGSQAPMSGMQYGQPNPLFPLNTQPMPQAAPYAQQPVAGGFCMRCGARLLADSKFCPACGIRLPEQYPAPAASVFARQEVPAAGLSECSHQFRHFVCVKCGEKAPKPQLISEGTRTQNQYTYEYYRAASAEEARYFLDMTKVTLPLYYVMVHTPEGTWGRDKDGIFLESLRDYQHNISLAQCEAKTALFPQRLQDLQMAANKVTDNYILSITCGYCGYEWMDGVGYRTKTVVKCPECGRYNLADTENIRVNNL
jgi:hypothetical protein